MYGTASSSEGNDKPLVHEVYLVRHGESRGNVAKICFPPEEDTLTQTGREQADLLGKHLKNIVFTIAYASPYVRASDTANFILGSSKMKNKPELKLDPRIREREVGDFVNRPAIEAYGPLIQAMQQGTSILNFEIPGAETTAEFEGRIDSFIEDLFDELRVRTQPETVCIVSHGMVISRLMAKLKEWEHLKNHSLDSSWNPEKALTPLQNTSYHIFSIQIPSKDSNEKLCFQFLEYHNSSHLDCLNDWKGVVDHGGGCHIASIVTKLVDK